MYRMWLETKLDIWLSKEEGSECVDNFVSWQMIDYKEE